MTKIPTISRIILPLNLCYSYDMLPKKPRGLVFKIIFGILLLLGSLVIISTVQTMFGKSKFQKAILEVRAANPTVDNPCLGYSVLRSHSYAELFWTSDSEIVSMIMKDQGSC